ncbi:MAG: MBL fold metallo-hydrolase [Candidatus Cryptobacteroides sp.]
MINTKYFIFNAFQENCIVVWDDEGNCAIVDPGFCPDSEGRAIEDFIASEGLNPKCVLLTHGHFDHIYGVKRIAGLYGIPVYMSSAEKVILEKANGMICGAYGMPEPDTDFAFEDIREGDMIEVGSLRFEVIATPGHTPGGVCYLERNEKVMLSGDTLFAGCIGRTDNQWGDYDALISGILDKLMVLDGDIIVLPGHGPQTTIADERMRNPFLQPFNEPWEEDE